MINALDISTSALVAQRIRLNTISSNLANIDTPINENGETKPFQARDVIFQVDDELATKHGTAGVKIGSVMTKNDKPISRYVGKGHPLADEKGFVQYPNINLNEQFVNALVATRAYEANVGVIEVTKNMGQQALRIVG